MTTPAPDTAAALQAANARADRYLAVLWKHGYWCERSPLMWEMWYCRECGHSAVLDRAAVRHAPGCVFFDLDPATVAALDAWEGVGA